MKLSKIDTRQDQLSLLKLEKRALRPLANSLLGQNNSKKRKLSAIAATAAILIAVQAAPISFHDKLGSTQAQRAAAQDLYKEATDSIAFLERMVANNASQDKIMAGLVQLFNVVDDAHASFERMAKVKNAILINPTASGGGGKSNVSWLTQHITGPHTSTPS